MKRITKSVLAGLAALTVAGSMISCGGAAAGWEDDLNEHVKVVYMTTGNKPTNGATERMLEKLNKILTEKVNAELEIYYIPWTNYQTQYNLTLAQMDGTVDLVGTASDWLDAWKNSKNGAFSILPEDMIKKYAPMTYETVSKDHWEMCKYEDDIYLIPEDNYAQWINHGFMYRNDWAKEAGLKDGVHSWEQLTRYLEYLTSLKKDGFYAWDSNGAQSTYHAEGYVESKSDYVPLDGINSYNMFGVRRSDLKKVYSPFLEGNELVEYAKLMKHWDEIGVWKKDVFNNSSDNRSEFYLGQTGIEQHHTQTWYTQVRPKMEQDQPGSDVQFFWFGEESGNVTTMTITHGAMALSAASKHKARALAVYDLIRNDKECYNLFNYGIEGEQYILTADGKYRARPEGYSEDVDGIVTNFWWGRNDDLEIRDVNGSWDKFDEICGIYDKVKLEYPYGQIVWDIDPINSELSNISDVWTNYMGNICYGKMQDPEAYVAEFREQLKRAGIDRVLQSLQSQVDVFLAGK